MSKLPIGYRLQEGCYSCKRVYVRYHQIDGTTYYCVRGISDRREDGCPRNFRELTRERKVCEYGICDEWENRE